MRYEMNLQKEYEKLLSSGNLKKFVAFGIVGGLGTVLNTGLLYILSQIWNINYLIASAIATESAIIFNFIGNNYFTFRNNNKSAKLYKKFLSFQAISLFALVGTVFFLWLFVTLFGIKLLLLWNVIAILIMFVVNFALNKAFTWKERENKNVDNKKSENLEGSKVKISERRNPLETEINTLEIGKADMNRSIINTASLEESESSAEDSTISKVKSSLPDSKGKFNSSILGVMIILITAISLSGYALSDNTLVNALNLIDEKTNNAKQSSGQDLLLTEGLEKYSLIYSSINDNVYVSSLKEQKKYENKMSEKKESNAKIRSNKGDDKSSDKEAKKSQEKSEISQKTQSQYQESQHQESQSKESPRKLQSQETSKVKENVKVTKTAKYNDGNSKPQVTPDKYASTASYKIVSLQLLAANLDSSNTNELENIKNEISSDDSEGIVREDIIETETETQNVLNVPINSTDVNLQNDAQSSNTSTNNIVASNTTNTNTSASNSTQTNTDTNTNTSTSNNLATNTTANSNSSTSTAVNTTTNTTANSTNNIINTSTSVNSTTNTNTSSSTSTNTSTTSANTSTDTTTNTSNTPTNQTTITNTSNTTTNTNTNITNTTTNSSTTNTSTNTSTNPPVNNNNTIDVNNGKVLSYGADINTVTQGDRTYYHMREDQSATFFLNLNSANEVSWYIDGILQKSTSTEQSSFVFTPGLFYVPRAPDYSNTAISTISAKVDDYTHNWEVMIDNVVNPFFAGLDNEADTVGSKSTRVRVLTNNQYADFTTLDVVIKSSSGLSTFTLQKIFSNSQESEWTLFIETLPEGNNYLHQLIGTNGLGQIVTYDLGTSRAHYVTETSTRERTKASSRPTSSRFEPEVVYAMFSKDMVNFTERQGLILDAKNFNGGVLGITGKILTPEYKQESIVLKLENGTKEYGTWRADFSCAYQGQYSLLSLNLTGPNNRSKEVRLNNSPSFYCINESQSASLANASQVLGLIYSLLSHDKVDSGEEVELMIDARDRLGITNVTADVISTKGDNFTIQLDLINGDATYGTYSGSFIAEKSDTTYTVKNITLSNRNESKTYNLTDRSVYVFSIPGVLDSQLEPQILSPFSKEYWQNAMKKPLFPTVFGFILMFVVVGVFLMRKS
jgi:putative flippase GtrA